MLSGLKNAIREDLKLGVDKFFQKKASQYFRLLVHITSVETI